MKRTHSQKLIAWAVALLSVAVAWELDFPSHLDSLAFSLGATHGTILHSVIVDGGISITFVGIAWLSLHLYEDVLWRWWPRMGCKRGWWVYSLVAQRDGDQAQVVGIFYLLHTVDGVEIREGFAWYYEDGSVTPRGKWHASSVWTAAHEIRALFSMRAVRPPPEALPSMYEGYMSLSCTTRKPLVGVESWEGYFHDLGERHSVSGWVYAERLPPFLTRNRDRAEQDLRRSLEQFVGRAKSMSSPLRGEGG